ncbi:uncharacterized protein LOC110272002 [Arachis ipaensis]|nr:uncharacterized protein LOC110272002 [Arachis ipaensis]
MYLRVGEILMITYSLQGIDIIICVLTTSWHAQLSINLAMLGSLTIVVAHHMYSMPPYPYLATDYGTQLSLFTHHMWIGGFLIVGDAVHAAIFMVRDYDPTTRYNDLLDRVLRHRDAIISHLNWVCIFLGFHSFGLYIHNDTMSALGRPQDMFSDTAIQLQPVFAQWIQNTHALAPNTTAPGATTSTSLTWGGGDLVAVGGKVALLPIPLGTADFLVHHIHAFTIHVTVLILLKGVLFARSSRLIPDKANLGFRFPCDGPGRGGTCQVSAWDHVFLGLFWMYNAISVVIFHFSWKMQSDVWGTISDQGVVTHITGGNFAQSSITINGWLRDFLWAQASQVIQSYGSSLSAYGLFYIFAEGATPFFTLNWSKYADFLTFRGGLDPVTGGLWLTDIAHHHLAIAILFLIAGHIPYPNLATDYGTQLSLFTHHMWIGGFLIVGAAAHAAIFMVRDYDPTTRYNDLLDRVLRHRDAIISHLNWVCIFLGFHSFGLYIHNDTMSALGRPQDMFSDTAIQLQPVFAQSEHSNICPTFILDETPNELKTISTGLPFFK